MKRAKYVASLVCIIDYNHCNLEPCHVWNLLAYSKVRFTSCFCDLQCSCSSRAERSTVFSCVRISLKRSLRYLLIWFEKLFVKNLQNQFVLETDALSVLDELGKATIEQHNCLGSLDHSSCNLCLFNLMWPAD